MKKAALMIYGRFFICFDVMQLIFFLLAFLIFLYLTFMLVSNPRIMSVCAFISLPFGKSNGKIT